MIIDSVDAEATFMIIGKVDWLDDNFAMEIEVKRLSWQKAH